ncbi:MAG: hypothetical protein FJ276_28365 [Planctomycetes bacterium]|nr:hypothetical protein [Planctomycetota bacterium]
MSSGWFEIVMPQMGVNDDKVTIHSWLVGSGESIRRGQPIAAVETSKAAIDIESEQEGYFYPLVPAGEEVSVRHVVALVLKEPNKKIVDKYVARMKKDAPKKSVTSSMPHGVQITERARRLVLEHGVDLSVLPAGRIVREKDVLGLLGEKRVIAGGGDPQRRVAIYGASEGGVAVLECLRAVGGYEVVAFFDDTPGRAGTTFHGIPVWPGGDLESVSSRGVGGLVSHIAVREFRLRMRDRARTAGVTLLNVIHPRATIAESVRMGVGNIIKSGAILDAEVSIGDCCIIDHGAIVPHHNVIGDACHLAPGCTLGGGCRIGDCTLIGIGATVSSRVVVGRNVIVGVGACVVRDVPDDSVLEGNPARVVGTRCKQ